MRTLLLISAMAIACAAGAQTASLQPVNSGFMPKMGGYMPQRLQMSSKQPASVKKLPDGLTNASFGTLTMGGKDYVVCVGDLPGKPAQLFVDTNGDGDLTNDPAPSWLPRKQGEYTIHMGSAKVGFHLSGSTEPVSIGIYKFDPNDPQRAQFKDNVFYYADYGYTGHVQLGGKDYPILLTDDFASGDFKGKPGGSSGIRLLIDRNGDGKFSEPGKVYDTHKPFNIDGTTYEVAGINSTGQNLTFKVSATQVAEIPLPLTFKVGSVFPGFTAATMDNHQVRLPNSYKGRIVMLDFWATWCGPCMGEVPNITATYEKYHDKGFDILGISLDQKDSAAKVISTTKEKNMTWPQVYDGKYWSAEIAVKYGIQSIPHAFLIDGDTGVLLADGDSLRGEGLTKIIEQALTKKGLLKLK